jgi:hypothetical protein
MNKNKEERFTMKNLEVRNGNDSNNGEEMAGLVLGYIQNDDMSLSGYVKMIKNYIIISKAKIWFALMHIIRAAIVVWVLWYFKQLGLSESITYGMLIYLVAVPAEIVILWKFTMIIKKLNKNN